MNLFVLRRVLLIFLGGTHSRLYCCTSSSSSPSWLDRVLLMNIFLLGRVLLILVPDSIVAHCVLLLLFLVCRALSRLYCCASLSSSASHRRRLHRLDG